MAAVNGERLGTVKIRNHSNSVEVTIPQKEARAVIGEEFDEMPDKHATVRWDGDDKCIIIKPHF